MSAAVEAVLWCPLCEEAKGEIQRIPTGNEGVYTHRRVPDPLPTMCDLHNVPLQRKQ